MSLATVCNTLHQFIEAGLLREVVVNSGHSYFDTNVSDHPAGAAIRRIDVLIRVGRDPAPAAD